ncbi:proteasomal ATPase-associated factor 1 [Biomphalaria pfeifferi]|uniref:Proteasomal ATPase-associated factor 1 n=1 Tax=Biomphalaria pfeifferi TaxID=112525 RepID=A0AAD8C2I3_BIOPF|nr:proteasomal ATPase-associated factor 1 [Biomphalaria pfeifferi]
MSAPVDRLILQSDWEQTLRERHGKAWVAFKSSAPPSEYSEVIGHGTSPEGLLYLTSKDKEFSISDITKRSLVVTYSGENATLTRKFVSPTITFTGLHTHKKQVTGLDTTLGGLGVSCDSEGKLKIWQTSDGEIRRELLGHVGDVYTCRFFPSGIVILSAGADTMIKIWSAESGSCAATITGHKAAVLDSVIVDRGRNIITSSRDGTAKLWDVGQQTCLATFEDIGGDVKCCSLEVPENTIELGTPVSQSDREVATEGKMLLLGCENGSLQGFGLASREQIFSLHLESAINTCTFVSDIYSVCGSQDGHIHIVDLRNTSQPLKSWKESRGPVLSMLSHKGGFFTSTGDGSCFHINERWETTTELTGSDCDPVYKVCDDGSNIYTSCRDGFIRKYSLNYIN